MEKNPHLTRLSSIACANARQSGKREVKRGIYNTKL